MIVGSLFSGIGMLDFGLTLAGGFEHAWFCESDPWRRERLAQRWPGVLIFDDIRELRADDAGPVDVLVGGFPCKGVSAAGKREGFGHPETVLWRVMRRVAGEMGPRYIVVENVADLLGLQRGELFGEVLGDLASLGFDVVWDVLPAAAFGAPHLRQRVVAIAADTDQAGRQQRRGRKSGSAQLLPERDGATTPNPPRHAEGGPEAPSGSERERAGGGDPRCGDAPSHASGVGLSQQPQCDSERREGLQRAFRHDAERCGVDVGWGKFGPAIERWERIHGPAPRPLVRRVDDGASPRVVRSRLSALGDGVQIDLGIAAGRYILNYERQAVSTDAA